MHHILEHIDLDIKGDKANIRTQQYIKLNSGAKEIQQVNPLKWKCTGLIGKKKKFHLAHLG